MRSFLSGLGAMGSADQPTPHPLLTELTGQTVIHTRVAARGTWTVTGRGWVVHSRMQRLDAPALAAEDPGSLAVTLRDARVVGTRIQGAEMLGDGMLRLVLQGPAGPLTLSTVAPWQVEGPRGALLQVAPKGEVHAVPPGPPVHASPERLAEHAASRPSGPELRLLERAEGRVLHPGDVVEVLTAAGALDEEEFERRGPLLLARLLSRGELQAGWVDRGVFTPWTLELPQVIEHIGATWVALGGSTPGPDMIAWFERTDAGRASLGPRVDGARGAGMSGYNSPGVVGGAR